MRMKAGTGGFLTMVFAVLGAVLFITMFSNILTAMEPLIDYANLSTFTALSIGLKIAPTVLLLAGTVGAAALYTVGYKNVSKGAADAGGMIRIVFGILIIILFVTLFYTILTSMYTLYGHANASYYIAFTTVVAILPVIMFLMGIFGGVATAVGGYRARRRRRALAF